MTQSVYNIRTTTQDSFQMLPSICCQRELSEDEEGKHTEMRIATVHFGILEVNSLSGQEKLAHIFIIHMLLRNPIKYFIRWWLFPPPK